MSAVAVSPERAALIQRLHEALDALERGDETSMRAVIDALASARTRPLVQGLGRLARELSQALGELPRTPAEDGRPVELDDAGARPLLADVAFFTAEELRQIGIRKTVFLGQLEQIVR